MCRNMVQRALLPDGPDGRTIEAALVDDWWSSKGNPETDTRQCWKTRD